MIRRYVFLAVLLLVVVFGGSSASAYFGGTEVFIASTGSGPGAAESQWDTTLWVHNPGASPANVQFSFLLRNQTNASTPYIYNDTIPPGDTRRYVNAVGFMFGIEGFGAIRVVSNQSVLVNSRIYSTPSAGQPKDTTGQFFAAVPVSFAIESGASTHLLGVYQTTPHVDSQFRYNFGFVEAAGGTATVRVSAHNNIGTELDSRQYVLGPYEVRQQAFATEFPSVSSANVRLQVAVQSGTGSIIAFGSGLANRSNDPSTFEMAFDEAQLGTTGLSLVEHDATLTGDGTSATPLGLTVPIVVSSSIAFQPTIKATTNGGETAAIDGRCTSGCSGVAGHHTPSGNYGYIGWHGSGVLGSSSDNEGVEGRSSNSFGVVGTHLAATGIHAGVYGTSNSTQNSASAVHGRLNSNSPGSYSAGVRGENLGIASNGIGVWGSHAGSGWGVYGTSVTGRAVYGRGGNQGNGVYAYSSGSARDNAALRASNMTTSAGMAGYFTNNSNYATAHFRNYGSGEAIFLQANGGFFIKAVNHAENDAEFTVDYNGNVRADGTFSSPAADFAELLPAHGRLEPGDLVAIGPDGKLILTDTPMQTSVVGIYSTKPAFLGGDSGEESPGSIPLAIIGIVPVKASAENGAIHPGDLLVASAIPGHAMRCADRALCSGAVVGKAMSGLETGRGTISSLVSLQ